MSWRRPVSTGRPVRVRRPTSLAGRLMTAQILVIAVGSLTLALTADLVAPRLFRSHLARAGAGSGQLGRHADQAFASSVALSLAVATLAALLTAGLASWLVVRRIAGPIEQLARVADAVAAGDYSVGVSSAPVSAELALLTDAVSHMAGRLADTDSARSRLLSDLSHELRTPLATLSAYIDGMEDGVVRADPAAWETMRGQVGRLRRLATDVREVAAAQEQALDSHPGPTDPVAMARDAIAAAAPRFAAGGVHLTYGGDRTAPSVSADPERIGQVLANLLDNAFRHTPAGGHVSVAVLSGPGQVLLRVQDDGDGIPPDQLHAIFDRFHRADPARTHTGATGSGLGLTIALAIVRAHGGTLTAADNGPQRTGASFTVALPALPLALRTPATATGATPVREPGPAHTVSPPHHPGRFR